jgi:hypothetical protein
MCLLTHFFRVRLGSKQDQTEKIAKLDKSIAVLEKKNSKNESVIADLQKTDEKLSAQIEALQVCRASPPHLEFPDLTLPGHWFLLARELSPSPLTPLPPSPATPLISDCFSPLSLPCPVFNTLQHTAAEDSAKLDELEEQCTDLSNQLQESEVALAETQEMERKCSREYIAYEKAIKKKQAAQANRGKGKFGS